MYYLVFASDSLTLPYILGKCLLTDPNITFPGNSSLITAFLSSETDYCIVLRPSYVSQLDQQYHIVFLFYMSSLKDCRH